MPMKKLILSISLPLMISLLVQSLYNIVDSIFVARLSEDALSAVSLSAPIQTLMVAVSVGTGVGVNSLLSRTLGKGDREESSDIADNGLFLAAASYGLFLLFGLFGAGAFIRHFAKDGAIAGMGIAYLRIVTCFSLGIFLATTAERLLQATGNTLLSMIAQVTGAVMNCILDPILIFGLFGMPAMGIRGAAIATVAGQFLAAGLALILNVKKNREIHFDFQHFRIRGDIIGRIYKVGAPSILVMGLTSIQTMVINNILVGYSTTAVAFFGVFHKLQNFTLMPINGLAQGLIPIVGYSYGAKKGSRIREALRITFSIGLTVAVIYTAVILLFPDRILSMFSAGEVMMKMGIPALRILCSSLAAVAVCSVVSYTYTGMGNGMVNMICTAIRCLVPIPVISMLSGAGYFEKIWWAIPAADVLAALAAALFLIYGIKTIIRPMEEAETR